MLNSLECCNYRYHFRYFADVLNILQGVYIFVIFVCKKDVLTVIINKEVGSYSLESTKDDSINSEYTLENVEMDSVNYDRRVGSCKILTWFLRMNSYKNF